MSRPKKRYVLLKFHTMYTHILYAIYFWHMNSAKCIYIYKIITIDKVFQYLNYSNDDSAIS